MSRYHGPWWRYIAHRTGLVLSPSLLFMGVPFSNRWHRRRILARKESPQMTPRPTGTAPMPLAAHAAALLAAALTSFAEAVEGDAWTTTTLAALASAHLFAIVKESRR